MTLINGEWKSNEQSKALESESVTGLKAEKKVSDAEPLVNGNKCVEDVSNTANRQETSVSKDFDLNAGAKNRDNYNNDIFDDEYFSDALEEQYMSSEEEQVNGTEGNSERVSIPEQTSEIQPHSNIMASTNDKDKQTPVQQAIPTSRAYKVITPTRRRGVLNIDPAPASNNQSGNKKNLKSKSAHGHHLEENIIDNEKNIIQNSSPLTEQLFTNDYEEGEMNEDNQRYCEPKVSDNVENVGDNQDPQLKSLQKLSFVQTNGRQNNNLGKDAENKQDQGPMPASSLGKKDSSIQNNDLDENNRVSKNTKSNRLGTIAACCALVAAGVALGVAIAVHFEMLVVGIAIGACCIVAAAAVHYYGKPSQSLENSNAHQVTEKLEIRL